MKTEAEELFEEIAALPKNGRTRRYTADVRRRVVAFVDGRIASGGSEASASAELGMHQATITGWRGGKKGRPMKKARAKARAKLRPVEVVAKASAGPVLLLGRSARVEGLSVSDVLALVKGLQ